MAANPAGLSFRPGVTLVRGAVKQPSPQHRSRALMPAQTPGERRVLAASGHTAVHRARDLLVRQRTSLINALRAHLAEFGMVVPKGAPHGRRLASMLIDGETFGSWSCSPSGYGRCSGGGGSACGSP
jgi:hypothetical protein